MFNIKSSESVNISSYIIFKIKLSNKTTKLDYINKVADVHPAFANI